MKLYHVADLHLGRRRLEGRLPDEDLALAFRLIAESAIQDKARVVLIAGDFFDRSQVEPRHLRQAQEVLRLLREHEISVIAVEGNHDKTFVHTAEHTWMQFLAEEELLILLRPTFNADGAALDPWDPQTRRGAWVEVEGVRFVGAGYLGAATPARTRQIVARLDGAKPVVLLLHAGPDYFVGEGGGFSPEDLKALEEAVCYLALGHIHKPMRHGGWACNPGSVENCELHEAAYDRDRSGSPVPRGYAVVEIDPSRPERPTSIEVRSNPRRPVHRVELDCSAFGNKTKRGPEALVSAAVKAIGDAGPGAEAIVDLRLTGTLNLNRIAVDQARLCEEIGTAAGVFAVALDLTRLNVGQEGALGSKAGESFSREDLERRAIDGIVRAQDLGGFQGQEGRLAELFYELKESVRLGRSPEEITEQIASSPLVEAALGAEFEKELPAPAAGGPGAEDVP